MPQNYSAANWYWIVAGDETQVYSSLAFAYVPVANSTYQAFLAGGNLPTRIEAVASLRNVLNERGVAYLAEPVTVPALIEERPRITRARLRIVAASFPVTSGVPRSIPWSAVKSDPLGMWSSPVTNPERIEIKAAGVYRFTLGVKFFEGTRAGKRAWMLGLGLGGSPTDLGTKNIAPALAGDTSDNFTEYTDDALAVGNILRGFVEQTSGGTINAVARLTILREE